MMHTRRRLKTLGDLRHEDAVASRQRQFFQGVRGLQQRAEEGRAYSSLSPAPRTLPHFGNAQIAVQPERAQLAVGETREDVAQGAHAHVVHVAVRQGELAEGLRLRHERDESFLEAVYVSLPPFALTIHRRVVERQRGLLDVSVQQQGRANALHHGLVALHAPDGEEVDAASRHEGVEQTERLVVERVARNVETLHLQLAALQDGEQDGPRHVRSGERERLQVASTMKSGPEPYGRQSVIQAAKALVPSGPIVLWERSSDCSDCVSSLHSRRAVNRRTITLEMSVRVRVHFWLIPQCAKDSVVRGGRAGRRLLITSTESDTRLRVRD